MRRSALPLFLLAVGLSGACGARSNLEAASSSASGGGAASASTSTSSSSVVAASVSASASSGSGGSFPHEVWSRQRLGRLARHPLAVDGEGHIWLLGADAHLWKLSPYGDAEIDATSDGGPGFSVLARAIHADAAGGVLIAAQALRQPGAATTLTIGGAAISFPFPESAFLVKLDAEGKHVWSHVYNAGISGSLEYGNVNFVNIGADAAGRWHVLLYAHTSVDLGAGKVFNDGPIDLVLSSTGAHVADLRLPSPAWVSLNFTVEPSGHFWLAGGSDTCGFGLKVQRFDPAGKLLVDACPPSTCWAESPDLALDGAGGVFIIEDAEGASHCNDQIYLRRMDASGNVTWALHGQTGMYSTTVATTPDGHVTLGASFYGPFELGSGPLVSPAYEDDTEVIVGDIDAQGKVLSVAHHGGKGEQQIAATAIDPVGARVIAGQLSGVVDFGDGPLEGDSEDPSVTAFVARFPP